MKKDLRQNKSKAIIVRNIKTREEMYFKSIKDCCSALNINKTTIQRNIKRQTTTRYGLIFKLATAR